MKKKVLVWFVSSLFFLSMPAFASDDVQILKDQLEKMSQTMEMLQKKIEAMEEVNKEEKEEVEYLSGRMDKAELHTSTDKLSLGVELRTEVHSLHYGDMQVAPQSFVNTFMSMSGSTLSQIQQGMAGMVAAGMVPPTEKFDAKNENCHSDL